MRVGEGLRLLTVLVLVVGAGSSPKDSIAWRTGIQKIETFFLFYAENWGPFFFVFALAKFCLSSSVFTSVRSQSYFAAHIYCSICVLGCFPVFII